MNIIAVLSMVFKHIFLTGLPGVGKSTLIKKVIKHLQDSCTFPISGFYTEELRENRSRVGFDCIGINGIRGPLARVEGHLEIPQRRLPTVGKYMVLVDDFETIVIPSISSSHGLIIIDEIGKMELFSSKFKSEVLKLLESKNLVIFGTIPIQKNIPFVEAIRQQKNVKVIEVTVKNRNDDEMFNDIVNMIKLSIATVTHTL